MTRVFDLQFLYRTPELLLLPVLLIARIKGFIVDLFVLNSKACLCTTIFLFDNSYTQIKIIFYNFTGDEYIPHFILFLPFSGRHIWISYTHQFYRSFPLSYQTTFWFQILVTLRMELLSVLRIPESGTNSKTWGREYQNVSFGSCLKHTGY